MKAGLYRFVTTAWASHRARPVSPKVGLPATSGNALPLRLHRPSSAHHAAPDGGAILLDSPAPLIVSFCCCVIALVHLLLRQIEILLRGTCHSSTVRRRQGRSLSRCRGRNSRGRRSMRPSAWPRRNMCGTSARCMFRCHLMRRSIRRCHLRRRRLDRSVRAIAGLGSHFRHGFGIFGNGSRFGRRRRFRRVELRGRIVRWGSRYGPDSMKCEDEKSAQRQRADRGCKPENRNSRHVRGRLFRPGRFKIRRCRIRPRRSQPGGFRRK